MSGVFSTERVFSLPSFEGFRLLRKYMNNYPDLAISDLRRLIDSVEADAHSLDMEASVYLSELVENDCPLDGHLFYQTCIRGILFRHQPNWVKLMRQGRERFLSNLYRNIWDIFAAAGLVENPPPLHVVTWWDYVSGFGRVLTDQGKMEQGRSAEALTLEHERKRLQTLGIDREPQWPGLDDNFAGYDVLSYDYGLHGIQNKLIEVKSTMASPLRFFVTRNEWDQAERAQDAYHFHVWDMTKKPAVLVERTVAEVAPHIPVDSGKGGWTNAQVPVHTR
ncbi:MAG: DUF3883 domain-containing protein [Oceanicaulis sp.]|nr:DUF3883 domain-containing protein [Oceanicaulis sp.]